MFAPVGHQHAQAADGAPSSPPASQVLDMDSLIQNQPNGNQLVGTESEFTLRDGGLGAPPRKKRCIEQDSLTLDGLELPDSNEESDSDGEALIPHRLFDGELGELPYRA